MKFNLSYSSLSLYRESPRTFFYQYILKIKAPDEVSYVYGDAGNIVHSALENYINKQPFNIEQEWIKKKLNINKSFNEQPLSLPAYKLCVEIGKRKIDGYRLLGYNLSTESKIEFNYDEEVVIKGFIDVIITKDNTVLLVDWKTDGSADKGKHREQRLFYSWMYWKFYKIIPHKCIWYYLKLDKEDSDSFTLSEIEQFDKYIDKTINEIKQKGMIETNYEIGDLNNPFNGFRSLMEPKNEENKSEEKTKTEIELIPDKIKLRIKNARIHLEDVPDYFIKDLVGEFSYEVKDSFFVKRAMGKKGVNYDGYKRFYRVKDNTLPLGFLNRLKNFLLINNFVFEIIDERAELKEYEMTDKINIELRDYQKEAVDFIMENKITFLEIATSGGKTAIAAEIIRQGRGLALFVVDRNVLLSQVKKEFEFLLKEEVGTFTEGKIDLKKINVASIQTINSLIDKKDKNLIKILANIKTLIIDEGHTTAASSFIKLSNLVLNAVYRVGMSGTFNRDDGNSMMIESVVGYNEFKINAKELIDKGFIMEPKIVFIKLNCEALAGENYSDYYDKNIIYNNKRNDIITKIVNSTNKNVLILISKIRHGELLQERIPESVFIQGNVDGKIRDEWIEDMKRGDRRVIIGTMSIIGKGLNIPNLDWLINATGNLSSIVTIQSLGRILRKSPDKEAPVYIDFIDNGKYLYDHSMERMNILKKQGHEVKIMNEK